MSPLSRVIIPELVDKTAIIYECPTMGLETRFRALDDSELVLYNSDQRHRSCVFGEVRMWNIRANVCWRKRNIQMIICSFPKVKEKLHFVRPHAAYLIRVMLSEFGHRT